MTGNTSPKLAVIGGSGLYGLKNLCDIKYHDVNTPFGKPSAKIAQGKFGQSQILFLARHGRGHHIIPSRVNYRANIFALKTLGAERILSISAVGSLKEDIHPGNMIIVDQFIDRTRDRPSTFFDDEIAAHVMFADPVCPELCAIVKDAAVKLDVTVHSSGTLMVMEGPAFSTRAESAMHRLLGADLVGMTALPEAKLAREAELCYSTLALATDYDCWYEGEEDVSVDSVLKILNKNADNAAKLIEILVGHTLKRNCDCGKALTNAIITDRKVIKESTITRLKPILGRVL